MLSLFRSRVPLNLISWRPQILSEVWFLVLAFSCAVLFSIRVRAEDLSGLKRNEKIAGFTVSNLYADSNGKIMGAKFVHDFSHAPFYVLQIDTAPQGFVWVDAPETSNRGLAHALEHLLVRKGTAGRYLNLLRIMRFGQLNAASYQDYNFYTLTSGTGMDGFSEEFAALLNALYRPDFTDVEAEREFYHLGVDSDPKTKQKRLVEQGTVYNEMQTGQGIYHYYFELNRRIWGESNPFAFFISGVPDEMRSVTPSDIHEFQSKHYRLGPSTGFIVVLPPKASVSGFLRGVSNQLANLPYADATSASSDPKLKRPKYPFQPSSSKEIGIYQFPSSNDTDRGDVAIGWAPAEAGSQSETRLLELFVQALADGERSILYRSLIDSRSRQFDSGAASVQGEVLLKNSPWFPSVSIILGGIPGDRINRESIEQIRQRVIQAIQTVSKYPDHSSELMSFNQLVTSYAKSSERNESIWIRNSPRFTVTSSTDWKERLSYLEMDHSFVRSLSDTPVWREIESQIASGRNIWRTLAQKYHLLELPYSTASVPSPRLRNEIEQGKQARIQAAARELEARFGMSNEQQALAEFEQLEQKKTAEIDKIDARVRRPRFPDDPPLTPDDNVQYKQFNLDKVPVIAVLFDGAPTIDVGFSFDLRQLPPKYYKYLPVLPRCFDSLGLKTPSRVVSYSELLEETQKHLNRFSVAYDSNPLSHRADLEFRWQAASPVESDAALNLIKHILRFSNTEITNLDRIRDVVNQRIADDDRYARQGDSAWYWDVADAFRYQDDPLYLALNSRLTQAHWDNRLKWLFHDPVSRAEIESLHGFAERILASLDGLSPAALSAKLSRLQVTGLENELVQYWQRSIPVFPETEIVPGLREISAQVQEDLTTGPTQALEELKEAQTMIVNRRGLKIDITIEPGLLDQATAHLSTVLQTLPMGNSRQAGSLLGQRDAVIMRKVELRNGISGNEFPWYVGFEDPHNLTGAVSFSADFLDNSHLDRSSLVTILASMVGFGTGPHTFYMKTFERGLAYSSGIVSDPERQRLVYYADRVPDIPSLVNLVNSLATGIAAIDDPDLINYILKKAFPSPRSTDAFSDRGKDLAHDIYDGNGPAKMCRFSQAILKLKSDPNLLSEILHAGRSSIAPVLLSPEFKREQRLHRSIFFFFGPERLLADAEKRLETPTLLRLYMHDFWVDIPPASRKLHQTSSSGMAVGRSELVNPLVH